MKKILIIDDEQCLSSTLAKVLKQYGYHSQYIQSKKEWEALPHSLHFDCVLLDLKLPDANGLDLMQSLKNRYKNAPIIIMTGFGTIDLAVSATKQGAFHFITKPFNLGEIVNLVAKALSHSLLETQNSHLLSCVKKQYCFDEIIGQSSAILNMIEMIKKVSHSSATILITGESGTGKELVAKSIHFNSTTSEGPFIPVHCEALPTELLESELFGHIKGSFTGAIKDRIGRFQQAQGGTLFLDEVSTMSLPTQVKLLRVLQEKEFQPVGSEQIIQSNVRIIAATNENLEIAVKKGRFRKDLFYRLNVIPFYIPPLRERTDDVPILIKYFINERNKNKQQLLKGISPKAIERLCHYNWPGNIRELENLIERLCVLKHGGLIEAKDLPERYLAQYHHLQSSQQTTNTTDIPESGLDFNNIVNHFENELILKALTKTKWNRNQAAKLLKLNRTTLLEKMKKKGLKQNHPDILENTPHTNTLHAQHIPSLPQS